ncbi:Protein of unknown function [Pedobacter sp. ok626]|nr:Protein of unknown function [Pedobacter sp. ok626]
MSGNTTQLGTAISADQWEAIITSTTVIGCFVLGIYGSTLNSLAKNAGMLSLPFLGAWILTVPALLLLICSLLISILNFKP